MSRAEELSENIAFKREEAEAYKKPLWACRKDRCVNFAGEVQALVAQHNKLACSTDKVWRQLPSLAQAIRDKRQVVARLSFGQLIKSATASLNLCFSDQCTVQCLEVSSRTTKFFKIERIGLVRIEGSPWQFEYLHESRKQDAFGMTLHKPKVVRFKMGLLSSNLLREEYPAAAMHLRKENDGSVLFEGEVAVTTV